MKLVAGRHSLCDEKCCIVLQVGLMAQTGSVYLTVCVAVERYVAVCHPLKAKSLCTFGRAKMYVICTAILSIGQLL